jgi:hypothetical protein
MSPQRISLLLFLLPGGLSAQTTSKTNGASAFEVPPVFNAAQSLSPDLLSGPHHRVREMAPSDGFLIHYTVDSDFGVYNCVGTRELERRIAEIGAIARLTEVSRGDLFAKGLKQSIEAPVDAVKNIVASPTESVKQVPQTVGHFFGKVGSSVGRAARKVGQRFGEAENVEGVASAVVDTGKGLGKSMKGAAGFEKAKLDCARQLGIDPYSDNALLQSEMEKVTWAFFAGGLPIRVGTAVASTGASVALSALKVVGLPADIYDLTPAELALRDRERLSAMGVDGGVIEAVFSSPGLSVTTRHRIVKALDALPAGPGRGAVLSVLASSTEGRRMDFLADVLDMLAARHQVEAYESIQVQGRLPAGLRVDGMVEIAAPVDYISWTEEVAAFAGREDLPGTGRRLLLSGKISEAAGSQLVAGGWEIVDIR